MAAFAQRASTCPTAGYSGPVLRRALPVCAHLLPRRQQLLGGPQRQRQQPVASTRAVHSPGGAPEEVEDAFEGLPKEEDHEVPGTATDSLSSNTQLGRAVQSACSELELLSSLERDAQEKAQALLWKLGYKGNLHKTSTPEVAEACRSDT